MAGLPQRYIVLDTESTSRPIPAEKPTVLLTLQLGVAIVRDVGARGHPTTSLRRFRTPEQFAAIVDAMPLSNQPIVIFAHRMDHDSRQVDWLRGLRSGRYSATPAPETPNSRRYPKPLISIDGPVYILRCFRPDSQQILLLDSMQWLDRSIEEIGTWVNLPKLKDPGEHAPEEERFTYCERDAEILHAALDRVWRWLDYHGIHEFPVTVGTLAFQVYHRRFGGKRIVRPEDPGALKLDRHGYYGALVEALSVGRFEGPVHCLDVSSLYPFVMRHNLFPCAFEAQGDFTDEPYVPEQFDPTVHTAEVYLDSPWVPWPVKGSDATLHVTGRVRTVLCGPELAKAFELGVVVKVGRWVRWAVDDLFTRFVDTFWLDRIRWRGRKDKVAEYMAKAVMVRLHGKFGQRGGEWEYVGKTARNDVFAAGIAAGETEEEDMELRFIAGEEWIRDPRAEAPDSFVPIAAWTTSYGRLYMWELIHAAGLDNVYHIATDSLMVNGIGLGNLQLAGLVVDNELGRLHYEKAEDWVEVLGANTLRFEDREIRPGIKSGAVPLGSGFWEQEEWEGMREAIVNRRISGTAITTIIKQTHPPMARRLAKPDGSTVPWSISNWDIPPEKQSRRAVRRGEIGEHR